MQRRIAVWDAIGPLDDVLPNVRWEQLASDNTVHHRTDVPLSQPIDGECGDVKPPDPRRLELRPERHDEKGAKRAHSVPESGPKLPGSWGRSNAHPRKSSAQDFAVSALPPGKRALQAFSAGAALVSVQASDNVRRSAARASRQTVLRPQSGSRCALAPRRACRASSARCRRAAEMALHREGVRLLVSCFSATVVAFLHWTGQSLLHCGVNAQMFAP
jgi:hypothetical protein